MDVLFAKGKHTQATPIKLVYLVTSTPLEFQAQAMFVVPKRGFKKAHDRNKLKRRMKEVYRLNKNLFYSALDSQKKHVVLAFIFTGKKIETYDVIKTSMHKLLNNLVNK